MYFPDRKKRGVGLGKKKNGKEFISLPLCGCGWQRGTEPNIPKGQKEKKKKSPALKLGKKWEGGGKPWWWGKEYPESPKIKGAPFFWSENRGTMRRKKKTLPKKGKGG